MKESFDLTHPHIYAQWVDIGDGRDPAHYTYGSSQVFTWQCDEHGDHQWDSKIKVRSMGAGCPICANRIVLIGFNDLESKIPELAHQWDYVKNQPLTPSEVLYSSTGKYWWKCAQGHSIKASISDRKSKKTGEYAACAICYGRIAEAGKSDLESRCPEIARECISDIDLHAVTPYSSFCLQWRCNHGHLEEESVKNRVRRMERSGISCALCMNIKKLSDLAAKHDLDLKTEEINPADLIQEKKKITKQIRDQHRQHALEKKKEAFLSTKRPDIFDQLVHKELHGEISYNSAKKVEWVCEKGHIWDCPVYQRVNSESGCPLCKEHHYTSKGEKLLSSYVKSIYNGEIIENTRNVIHPYEIDIYLPQKKIAIEYNGLYWHSDQSGKDKNYHYNKWKRCAAKGIQLITVWEDDWTYREEIVQKMIAHKIGMSKSRKVYARRTDLIVVPKNQARDFCNQNHIQGYTPGSAYFGLIDRATDSLVAVSVWKKSGEDLRLERYCTCENVVGGMGKLLKAGILYTHKNSLKRIVTFSDHEVSDGGLYDNLGFIADKELRPDYKYVIGDRRIHKFNYRLKRFKEDHGLNYKEGLTESQLARLNNLSRVYDAGKTRWVMPIEASTL